jgi:hypothetical protein
MLRAFVECMQDKEFHKQPVNDVSDSHLGTRLRLMLML